MEFSMNPKMFYFGASRGKLLGVVFKKKCVIIDAKNIDSIQNLPPPTLNKFIQFYTGKINCT